MSKTARDNRVQIMMSAAEMELIDGWRYRNHIPTRSDAIRRLTQIGIATDGEIPKLIDTGLQGIGPVLNAQSSLSAAIAQGRDRHELMLMQDAVRRDASDVFLRLMFDLVRVFTKLAVLHGRGRGGGPRRRATAMRAVDQHLGLLDPGKAEDVAVFVQFLRTWPSGGDADKGGDDVSPEA